MSLLTLVQSATDLLGITRPTTVVASQDAQIRQLYALANEEGGELASRPEGGWQALRSEWTFTTTATPAQASTPVPPDWAGFIEESFFNRTTNRKIEGPVSPQAWQAIQARPAYASVYLMFRQRDGQFLITPTPPAGQVIAYEYLSNQWAKSQAGTPQTQFMADQDGAYLDERLMTLGIRWRYLKSKGFPYAEDKDTYDAQVDQAIARDGGSTALSLTGRP